MFVLPLSTRPRRPAERAFEGLFNICIVVNIASFVIAFADFYNRVDNTFHSYFGSGITFNYSAPLSIIFNNCSFEGSVTIGGVTATSHLTGPTAAAGFLSIAQTIIAVFVLQLFLIVICILSFNFYMGNIRHFRIGGSFLPVMTWLPTMSVTLSVAIIALIWGSLPVRNHYKEFVEYCAANYIAQNAQTFLNAEYDTNVICNTNLNWIFATVLITMVIIGFACLHHVVEGMRPGYVAFAKSLYPWESGSLCTVSKQKLLDWTIRRALYLEALDKGAVAAVSPFPPVEPTAPEHAPMAAAVKETVTAVDSGDDNKERHSYRIVYTQKGTAYSSRRRATHNRGLNSSTHRGNDDEAYYSGDGGGDYPQQHQRDGGGDVWMVGGQGSSDIYDDYRIYDDEAQQQDYDDAGVHYLDDPRGEIEGSPEELAATTAANGDFYDGNLEKRQHKRRHRKHRSGEGGDEANDDGERRHRRHKRRHRDTRDDVAGLRPGQDDNDVVEEGDEVDLALP